ncbi:hypothetical protein [Saccharopolyspora griseoalba]|uniref:Uncharacterized protein n=1 Tax=Saccharopolyspora griseoalba TaxID=1431848 RepID=A0ABW2LQQ4_9PSEU
MPTTAIRRITRTLNRHVRDRRDHQQIWFDDDGHELTAAPLTAVVDAPDGAAYRFHVDPTRRADGRQQWTHAGVAEAIAHPWAVAP